ncbi:VCBS repeat-containing protein [Verrucomicrobiaceae bacterium R5-34]|nr:VCBS repeat-containing protein [Verrucomicrobiaceae bacterium R5-34]
MKLTSTATLALALVWSPVAQAEVSFKKLTLSEEYLSEGASVGDLDADGHLDVIAGPKWWRGPDFKTSFSYAPVKVYPITGKGLSAYSRYFFTFPIEVTDDKWPDVLKVSLPAKPAELAINPGEKPHEPDNTQHSCEHCLAQKNICNESPQLLKVLPGDAKQLLAFSQNHITLAEPTTDPKAPWKVFKVSGKNKRFKVYSHGLGAADVNGDQLPDILEKAGWWQQPKNWDKKSAWKFHPYDFAPGKGGSQMFGYDIDGDGDTDVVTALDAHGYGLAWYEQIKSADGNITFKQHLIMPEKASNNPKILSFSQPHAMACADIDGDGIKDIVTGKCYFAHNGKDPGAKDPAVLYWFRTTRGKKGTTFTPHRIDDNSGVGRQISTADLNADGKEDIVISNKKGTYVFLQAGQ